MNTNKRVKFEIELIKLGFKRQWFQDKSCYWFVKNLKNPDLKLRIYVQFKPDLLALEIKNLKNEQVGQKEYEDCYNPVKWYKLTIKNIKTLIKKYGK